MTNNKIPQEKNNSQKFVPIKNISESNTGYISSDTNTKIPQHSQEWNGVNKSGDEKATTKALKSKSNKRDGSLLTNNKIPPEIEKTDRFFSKCENCGEVIEVTKYRLQGQKQKVDDVLKLVDKHISWYNSYEEDGETDRDILQQAKAIFRELRDLKSKLKGGNDGKE